MKQTISFNQFCDSFNGSYKNNFSYYGLQALFNYLEEYEESTDEIIELDAVGLCCEYTEYENFREIQKDYPDLQSIEELQGNTQVIEFSEDNKFMKGRTSGIIIQKY
tara:strand:+ start:559 stop:879 length:321 start_codon:yes stop_codon:yes gene_type:complete